MSTQKPHCGICAARLALSDAIAELGKAVAETHHLSRHWRTAHEKREASNFDAEERSPETLAAFDADSLDEARWYALYEEALAKLVLQQQVVSQARLAYHAVLKEYTDTRQANG